MVRGIPQYTTTTEDLNVKNVVPKHHDAQTSGKPEVCHSIFLLQAQGAGQRSKQILISVGKGAGWTAEVVWSLWKRESLPAGAHPARNLTTILTELSRIFP